MSCLKINLQIVYSWQQKKDPVLALRITNEPENVKSIEWLEGDNFDSNTCPRTRCKPETGNLSYRKNFHCVLKRHLKEACEIIFYL